MHRFVWDLHYPAPESVQHEYPISASYHDTPRSPFGPTALRGSYRMRLTVDGKSFTQQLTLKMDPRVKTSADDLRRQFDLESGIVDAMNQSYGPLQQVRSLREQLKNVKARVKRGQMQRLVDTLGQRASDLEGTEGGGGVLFLSTPEGISLKRLNVRLKHTQTAVESCG